MEKVSLPTKTKIAAWWIIIFGILAIIQFVRLLFPPSRPEFMGGLVDIFALIIFGPIFIAIGIVFLKSGSLIFKRRKLGWWLSTITVLPLGYPVLAFSFGFLDNFFEFPDIFAFLLSFAVLHPFILLLLDRKNFWKVAT